MGDPKEGPSPPTWKLAIVKWFGLFPPLLALSYGFNYLSQNYFPTDWWCMNPDGSLVLWFKLLCTTLILVPLLNLVITPLLDDWFSGFLYSDVEEEE